MTPLRVQMTEDMRVAGLAAGTQRIYLDGVRRLAKHYRRAPDQLSEAEVRAYLLGLRERGVALGTFKANHGGIQFLYRRTLDRDWPLFGGKKDLGLPPGSGGFAKELKHPRRTAWQRGEPDGGSRRSSRRRRSSGCWRAGGHSRRWPPSWGWARGS